MEPASIGFSPTFATLSDFFFEWYPLFGVFFMACLLVVFVFLLRSTMQTTKPETIKASKTAPVQWADVQGVDPAKDELMDVADWLRDPERYKALGAKPPRGVMLYGPPGTGRRCWRAPSPPRQASISSPPRGPASSRCSSAAARLGFAGCSRTPASPGAP